MSANYSKANGKIGVYKGYSVVVMTADEYIKRQNDLEDIVCVLKDEGMKMVLNGSVFGVLDDEGHVDEWTCRAKYTDQPNYKKKTEEKSVEPDMDDAYFAALSRPVDDFLEAALKIEY